MTHFICSLLDELKNRFRRLKAQCEFYERKPILVMFLAY